MPTTDDIDLGPEAQSFPPPPAEPAPVRPLAPVPVAPPPPPTMSGTIPAQSFDDPRYQQKIEREQMAIYQRAQNVAQAEKDVSSARRMLGILKADREIKSGVPVEQAMWNNMPYFAQPSDIVKNFKTLMPPRPPQMPTVTNFPGIPTPALIDQRGVPHFPPSSAMPKPEFKASVEEIAPGVKAAKLGPNHYQLLDRPQIKGTLDAVTKTQIQLWNDEIKDLRTSKRIETGEAANAIQREIADRQAKIMKAAAGASASAGMPERIRVKSKDGKIGTVPRSQLDQAVKEGYSLLNGN